VFAASEDWGGGEAGSALVHRITRAASELAELVAAREQQSPADPFAVPTPFEQLLAGR
jgi:FMN reductase